MLPLVIAMFMGLLFCTIANTMLIRMLTTEERALVVGMHQGDMKFLDIAENLDMP